MGNTKMTVHNTRESFLRTEHRRRSPDTAWLTPHGTQLDSSADCTVPARQRQSHGLSRPTSTVRWTLIYSPTSRYTPTSGYGPTSRYSNFTRYIPNLTIRSKLKDSLQRGTRHSRSVRSAKQDSAHRWPVLQRRSQRDTVSQDIDLILRHSIRLVSNTQLYADTNNVRSHWPLTVNWTRRLATVRPRSRVWKFALTASWITVTVTTTFLMRRLQVDRRRIT